MRILTSGSRKCRDIMSLVRYLSFSRAKFNVSLKALHISETLNSASDASSQLQAHCFRKLVPGADLMPTPVFPLHLADLK